jgi:stearoyl-CoA desaturase (delta-9 desaturase)
MTPPAVATPEAPARAAQADEFDVDTGTLGGEQKRPWEQVALALFIGIPFVAVLAAVPVAWGGFLGWHDVVIALVFYTVAGHGISIGFHRLFTHKSFKPNRPMKYALAITGSLAIEGPVVRWVADHRKHHKFSDREGDPHSPWKYGTSLGALTKGFLHAHIGWLFLAPAVIGGLWSWSIQGALTAFFWASLVRIALLHHVTWSINSICHAIGNRPFKSRDKSGNVWWLAIPSQGESWHNLHHSDPTCARHGVLKGQLDTSARCIWFFEKAGWVTDVRWPVKERLEARRVRAADV